MTRTLILAGPPCGEASRFQEVGPPCGEALREVGPPCGEALEPEGARGSLGIVLELVHVRPAGE